VAAPAVTVVLATVVVVVLADIVVQFQANFLVLTLLLSRHFQHNYLLHILFQ
jgi:hypothetical protein